MKIELQPVKSSAIKAVGHDPKHGLMVEFHGGGKYHYPDVTVSEHAAMMSAPSVGTHFQQHVKPKHLGVKV